MHEYVETMYDADRIEDKIQELTFWLGKDDPSWFGAKYLEHFIVTGEGTLSDHYTVYPASGTSDYVVVQEIDGNGYGGESASLSVGPVIRLRQCGFIIHSVLLCLDMDDIPETIDADSLPDDYLSIFLKYVGREHPILEYWDE